MGYTTTFKGQLRFTSELKASELAVLGQLFGEDCRDHPEWGATDLYYINLELTKDFSGLQWNGTEKTYEMHKLVNVVIEQMRKACPSFGLSGELAAQGESPEDRWTLYIGDDRMAHRRDVPLKGQKVRCPHCEESFMLEDA